MHERRNRWNLVQHKSGRVVNSTDAKVQATEGGAPNGTVCNSGGAVIIQKKKVCFQDERTSPQSAYPKFSKGHRS